MTSSQAVTAQIPGVETHPERTPSESSPCITSPWVHGTCSTSRTALAMLSHHSHNYTALHQTPRQEALATDSPVTVQKQAAVMGAPRGEGHVRELQVASGLEQEAAP